MEKERKGKNVRKKCREWDKGGVKKEEEMATKVKEREEDEGVKN